MAKEKKAVARIDHISEIGKSEAVAISTIADPEQKIGAIEQLRRASLATSRAGQHQENAKIEMALFALHNAKMKLDEIDIGDAVGEIKALL